MNVKTCIENRYSCRLYRNKSLPIEVINEIIDAARWAPSPKNRQPWRFIVLQGETKQQILDKYCQQTNLKINRIDYLMNNEIESEYQTLKIIEQAPVLILVFNKYPSKSALSHYDAIFDCLNAQSIGAATQNILLRATEMGLGSLWVGDILCISHWLSEQYNTKGMLVSAIVLGQADEINTKKSQRLPVSEIMTIHGG